MAVRGLLASTRLERLNLSSSVTMRMPSHEGGPGELIPAVPCHKVGGGHYCVKPYKCKGQSVYLFKRKWEGQGGHYKHLNALCYALEPSAL